MIRSDQYYMKEAYRQALLALEDEEVPIGAVVVINNKIIARAYNQVERLKDATAHAEMLAITAAQNSIGAKYLKECSLYVTVEPCAMCAGALSWSQVGKLVCGAPDPQRGYKSYSEKILHPKTKLIEGIMKEECGEILLEFFRRMRN